MQRRLLFVDDEPVLREMYAMIGSLLGENHEITTAGSGKEALALLENSHFDVVVSDLAMPGMDGLEFMNHVVRSHPESARIVISGFADQMKVAECLTVGHRYFSKPFEIAPLVKLLARIVKYSYLIEERKIRTLVCGSGAIPTPSETYQRLTEAISSDDTDLEEISRIVEEDAGLSTKLLQIVNSAQFGISRQIVTPSEALQIVGIEVLRALVAGLNVFNFYRDKGAPQEELRELWGHSLKVASAAREIARAENASPETAGECFLAGLLHDVGKLILMANAPSEYEKVVSLVRMEQMSLPEAEETVFGATHAELGAYLLALWGLPDSVIRTVENHHQTAEITADGFDPLAALYAAQALTAEDGSLEAKNLELIVRAGLEDRIPAWREAVRAV